MPVWIMSLPGPENQTGELAAPGLLISAHGLSAVAVGTQLERLKTVSRAPARASAVGPLFELLPAGIGGL